MKLVKASYEILSKIDREEILKAIEVAGRTCYKSEDKITEESAGKFVEMISNRNHYSVLEHQSISVRFICDRGVSHEIVRHRIASFSQESTRYCNYSKDKFGNELTFIDIVDHMSDIQYREWLEAMKQSESNYLIQIQAGCSPQIARSVLPNSLKTEIVVTANLREWKEIFRQRTSKAAHPQMREIMIPLCEELQIKLPEIFGDIKIENTMG